ncbi:MAG: family 16 glycosylhydrolase [Bacteroidales bacterium]|nr:family 16 glycosylhydrolase [Bacteroidales bacterium]
MFTPTKYYSLSTKRVKDTEAFERELEAFEKEHSDFINFEQGDIATRLKELNQWYEAKEPIRIKRELAALTYKNSEEAQLETEYQKLANSRDMKDYLKVASTDIPAFLETMHSSGKLNAPDQADADVKRYNKLQADKAVQHYQSLAGTETLKRFEELKARITSPEFIARKKYLQSSNKFKQSEAYAMLAERKRLLKSPELKRHRKMLKKNRFGFMEGWTVTFEDRFGTAGLNEQKWLNRIFWGDQLMGQSYTPGDSLQNYTSQNIEANGHGIKIITRKEPSQGLAWDNKMGFVPRQFGYTSGIINTGKSHRQTSGRIEAKVKLTCAPGVYHSMYLLGDKMLPQIDVFHKLDTDTTSVECGMFSTKGSKVNKRVRRTKGLNLSKSYIFTVEWDSKKIRWAINGSIVKTERNPLPPNMPLYLNFASGVYSDSASNASMEIEWVKCWEKR